MSNIRDVARESGCSIATVSRVLSADDQFKVKDETRQRIMNAVAKLGYKIPVKQSKRIQIGIVLAVTADKYSDPFFIEILNAIEGECEKYNFSIACVRSYEELSNRATMHEFLDSNLSCVILMEKIADDILFQIEHRVPYIINIDNDEDDYQIDGVGFDHRLANRQAIGCLLNKGYKRIGIISGSSPNRPLEDSIRISTYRDMLRKVDIEYDESLIKDCMWDLDLCAQQTRELMSLPNPPDAIFAGSDSLASPILGALYSMGLSCPDDVGIIGFNNIEPLCNHSVPPLTSISIPTREIGISTVRRLADMINGRSMSKNMKILFPTRVVERGSLKERI